MCFCGEFQICFVESRMSSDVADTAECLLFEIGDLFFYFFGLASWMCLAAWVMLITDVLHDGWIYWSIWCNNVLSVRSLCMNLSYDTEELEMIC